MQKISKDNTQNTPLKWAILGILSVLIVAGGYFGYKYYLENQANKLYSVGETASFPDFNFTVKKATFKPVTLDINQDYVREHGGVTVQEDCSTKSQEKTRDIDSGLNIGPSEYNICIRRNDIRKDIEKYVQDNSQLVIDYSIHSKGNVNSKDININLTPDSGRDVTKESELYLGAFQKDAIEKFFYSKFFDGTVYQLYGTPTYFHTPYGKNSLEGDINKDIIRNGYIYTDIRNSENSVDFKVTYKKENKTHTRIVRIHR
jgi:hypothetical protein